MADKENTLTSREVDILQYAIANKLDNERMSPESHSELRELYKKLSKLQVMLTDDDLEDWE